MVPDQHTEERTSPATSLAASDDTRVSGRFYPPAAQHNQVPSTPPQQPRGPRGKAKGGASKTKESGSTSKTKPPSSQPKKILFTFKRSRNAEFPEVVDDLRAMAYQVTEEQRRQYLAYAARKRKSYKGKAQRVSKKHFEAIEQCAEVGLASLNGTGAKRRKKSKDGYDEEIEGDMQDTEIREENAILGAPIGSANGWIFYQDGPIMRTHERFTVMNKVDRETQAMSYDLFDRTNSSRVPSCPRLADGALLILHLVRFKPQFRGQGIGMKLCVELLRHWQANWSKAVLLPTVVNTDRLERQSPGEYEKANAKLSAAFKRIGFQQLGNTAYLYQEEASFSAEYRGFEATKVAAENATPLCSCVEGMSERTRHLLRVPAESEFMSGRGTEPGDAQLIEMGYIQSHRFVPPQLSPPQMSMDRDHLRGFLHIVGTIGMLTNKGLPPTPARIAKDIDAYHNFFEANGLDLARKFLGDGGSVLDPLDMLLYKAQQKVELRVEQEELLGNDLMEDPCSLIFLDESLPRCPEHDGDFEGLRTRWWKESERPAHQRGPYDANLRAGSNASEDTLEGSGGGQQSAMLSMLLCAANAIPEWIGSVARQQ